jgi:hypothetical protein
VQTVCFASPWETPSINDNHWATKNRDTPDLAAAHVARKNAGMSSNVKQRKNQEGLTVIPRGASAGAKKFRLAFAASHWEKQGPF